MSETRRVVCVVQARMGSQRLPGKALRALGKRPMIAHVLERASAIRGVDKVILATSLAPQDVDLATFVDGLGYDVFCGDERDVLSRTAAAVVAMGGADVVVRVTGDCPLLAPEVGSKVVALHLNSAMPVPYTCNDTETSGYPDGTDVEAFDRTALEAACRQATDPRDREHVTPWMRRAYTWATLRCEGDYRALKLSVDREADYERVQRIHAHLAPGAWSLRDTLDAARAAGLLLP